MSSLAITQVPANPANYSDGRFGVSVNLGVIHTMQGYLHGTDAWFANGASQVSSHYGIGLDGSIHQYVQEGNTAWADGNWNYNLRSISIEFEDNDNPQGCPRTDQQYAAGAALIADISTRNGIPLDRHHWIGHREIPNTSHPGCPGNEDIDRLVREAAALVTPAVAVPPVAPPAPPQSGWVKVTAQPWLWVRTGPGVGYPVNSGPYPKLSPGTIVEYVAVVPGDNVAGDAIWLRSVRGNYFWAGGTNFNRPGVMAGLHREVSKVYALGKRLQVDTVGFVLPHKKQ